MLLGPLDFGAQLVGTVSAERTILLPLNVSLADLPQDAVVYGGGDTALDLALSAAKSTVPVTISSIRSDFGAQNIAFSIDAIAFSGGSSSQFQSTVLTAQDVGPASVQIRFAPTAAGFQIEVAVPQLSGARIDGASPVTAVLNLISPSLVNLLSATLLRQTVTGTGLPPILIAPNPLDFGYQSIGTVSPPLGFRITNKTAGDVRIEQIYDSADVHTQEFEPISDGCSGRTLAPDGECEVIFQFEPTEVGSWRWDLRVLGNFADTQASAVALTGTSDLPELVAEPASFDFGSRPITTAGNESMLFLSAHRDLFVAALRFDGAGAGSFAIVDETCVGQTLGGLTEGAVAIDFAPQHIGHIAATLLIIGSDQRTHLIIPVRGIGTPTADLKVCVGTSVAATDCTYTVTVTNDGPSNAVATNLWLQLPPGARFVSSDHSVSSPRENTQGILSWKLGILGRGDSVSVVAVASLFPGGPVTPAKAWASSATFDADPVTSSIDLLQKSS
jgi:uncharacterized repeat protein (TIGR01451 family)